MRRSDRSGGDLGEWGRCVVVPLGIVIGVVLLVRGIMTLVEWLAG